MAQNNMYNLVTLIKRLEAATTRLEDIASSTIELPHAVPALSNAITSPPDQSATPLPSASSSDAPAVSTPAPQENLPESVEEFDNFITQSVDKYVKASDKIGGLVAEQASKVFDGFKQQRRFLLISTKAKKPDISVSADMSVYQELLKPINEALVAVGNIKESNRGAPVFTQLSAVAEGIMVLAWVTVDNKPFKHVEESLGSAQFFGNRVLSEHKDKNPEQIEWINSFYQIFRDLTEYVKQYFPNGIPWNSQGQSAADVAKSISASGAAASPAPPAPPAAGGAPPPPPPPGPPPVLQIKEEAPSKADTGLGAVFGEINKGSDVTKGLRKVDKSEMTHKNPSLRAGSTVSDSDASIRGKSAPGKKPKPESMRVKKPPKKELDGNKWTIENYEKHSEPIEIEVSMSQSVLISKCNHTTIILKGKANAVTIENTQRLSLVVDNLVSTVDVVKSSNFALQVLGQLPTIMLDQLDGAQIYLSKDSVSTRIFSSKSSSINVNVLSGDEGDYVEIPLPYQICSQYDAEKGEMVNEIVEHAG
ncbi:adenylate cyclase associated N terminal-domain-containing protein [Xylaria bambusicola]|uniref:adenylate cyclase associated N terminal-domain-containing protein n=1 Tax=Xylaria bambusicola TaxID=326684 RepID=UPI002008948F|nr:adenylate cyclase associated N terminal-domain-containing protein [Xylaria bambusicola]KAI0523683.1 adenylate cyclase associated N terminal-domain-containing protein [Xylaria bambusicola]